MSSPEPPFTDFGFEKIRAHEKTQKVRELFNRVASSYDLMNDLMSLGMHRLWKQEFVQALPMPTSDAPTFTILDLAGGTGDISALMLEKYATCTAAVHCVLADLSEQMMQAGRRRRPFQGESRIHWVCSDGEALPLPDQQVDLCTVVFGLRNMTHPDRILREVFRVLKPGGQFFCLEFSAVTSPVLSGLYGLYSFQLIPRLGRWVAHDEEAYRYLVESIRRFPSQQLLADLMQETGLQNVAYENFCGGIAALHRGVRPHG